MVRYCLPRDSSCQARRTEDRSKAEYEMKQTLRCARSTTPLTPGRGLDFHYGSKDMAATSCHFVVERAIWAYQHLCGYQQKTINECSHAPPRDCESLARLTEMRSLTVFSSRRLVDPEITAEPLEGVLQRDPRHFPLASSMLWASVAQRGRVRRCGWRRHVQGLPRSWAFGYGLSRRREG